MIILPYKTSKLLGWITVTLVLLSTLFYILLWINKKLQKSKIDNLFISSLKKILRKLIPFIHSYHPVFGTAALITGIIHGYTLLQSIEIHSGYFLWLFIITLGLSGTYMKLTKVRSKYKRVKVMHRVLMMMTISIMIFHILDMKYF